MGINNSSQKGEKMMSTKYDSDRKIWSGDVGSTPLFHDNVTLGRSVLYLLNLNPEKVCQISADDGSKRTNGEIYQSTLKIAFNLQKLGCAKGDVVGFVCRNSHDLTPAFLAAFFLGAPPNAVDVAFSKDEIRNMFKTTSPKFVFCDHDVTRTVQKALLELGSNATIIVIGQKDANFTHIDDLLDDKGSQMEIMKLLLNPAEVDKRSVGAIICSSGTTGFHKGVAVSHKSLQLTFCNPGMGLFVGPTDKMFSFSSLYWLSGYTAMLMSIFSGVPRIMTTKPFSPELLLSIVKEYKVSMLITPPAHAAQLLNCPLLEKDSLANIRNYMCGGSLVTAELRNRIQPYLPNGLFTIGYGMTEVGGGVSAQFLPSSKTSVGTLGAGVTAKVLDEDGQQLGINEDGEIVVKTQTQFLGYYNNLKATKEILDKDGWIHTGDLGHFDEDGLLFITGRKKDVMKYNNFHVSASELEEILEKHPGVGQVIVVGIPDPVFTDLPAALVVKKNESTVSEEELIELVEKNVSDFKRLRGGVFFVNEIPMTPSGKLRKVKVKELAIELFKAKHSAKNGI
ncbi:probable 4-coumarate--CoA ligase 3 [Phlebotomus argentipes]|uniref:probable 4-coumarate--CoA ligase 3 n=1 Tax=Phlebotomus argentipes TaxID=94469 RepID=UPI0028933CE4|nr:probable 4-coumarate--CoA ligase 3 [Phlebotomus argentipes]